MGPDGVSNDRTRLAEFYANISKKKPDNKDRPPSAALLVRWTVADSKYGPGIRELRLLEG
jgi:hypothetical protein